MKTRQCDECAQFLAEEQNFHGFWITRVGLCLLGHKPRFYQPKATLDTSWGYKRKCAEYIPMGVDKGVGKPEQGMKWATST